MWKTASSENDLMLGMRDNLRKTAEETSPKHQLSEAIDLLDRASRLFEETGHNQLADQILDILNDAVIEAGVLPFPTEERGGDLLNAHDKKKRSCPLCLTDHEDPTNTCDYEECGHCGFDHGYEYEAATKWHEEHDPENDLYAAKDKGSKVNSHSVRKWMARNKERFVDELTGELNHTRLAEEAANELNLYNDEGGYDSIPEEIFEIAADFS